MLSGISLWDLMSSGVISSHWVVNHLLILLTNSMGQLIVVVGGVVFSQVYNRGNDRVIIIIIVHLTQRATQIPIF